MLLRRITQHVKSQNWFAVFVDFLIVVVGILIAFQFTKWADEQSDKQSLYIALERLQDEIKFNLSEIEKMSKRHEKITQAGKELLAAARNPELDEVPIALIGNVFVNGNTSGYSTSALMYVLELEPFHDLQDNELRLAINELPAIFEDTKEDEIYTVQRLDSHRIPYISQHLPVAPLWSVSFSSSKWRAYFKSEYVDDSHDVVSVTEFKQLASSREFQNEVINVLGYQALILSEQEVLRNALKNTLALIEKELH